MVGIVVLTRPPVARRLDWEDFDLLRVVGRQLASYLADRQAGALGEACGSRNSIADRLRHARYQDSQQLSCSRGTRKTCRKPSFAPTCCSFTQQPDNFRACWRGWGGMEGTVRRGSDSRASRCARGIRCALCGHHQCRGRAGAVCGQAHREGRTRLCTWYTTPSRRAKMRSIILDVTAAKPRGSRNHRFR